MFDLPRKNQPSEGVPQVVGRDKQPQPYLDFDMGNIRSGLDPASLTQIVAYRQAIDAPTRKVEL